MPGAELLTPLLTRVGRAVTRRLATDRDAGSVAVFTVVFAVAVIFLTALVVDGGNAMNARERAADIAGQASRAAADDISTAAVRSGQTVGGAFPIDWNKACPDAARVVQQYAAGLNANNVTMTTCGPGANAGEAVVTVRMITQPVIGGGLLGSFTETAHASATSECGTAVQQGVC